jgi:hypothetical protein
MLRRCRGCRVASAQRAMSALVLRPRYALCPRDALRVCLCAARVPVRALWPMHTATHAYSELFATVRAPRCPNDGESLWERKFFLVSSRPVPFLLLPLARFAGRRRCSTRCSAYVAGRTRLLAQPAPAACNQ